jgi:hypothetical protein
MVASCHKSTLHFRMDLTKLECNIHPCGMLHFKLITIKGGSGGNGPSYHHHHPHHHNEEHAFIWITCLHNEACLSSALLHMLKFGFNHPKNNDDDNANDKGGASASASINANVKPQGKDNPVPPGVPSRALWRGGRHVGIPVLDVSHLERYCTNVLLACLTKVRR